MNCDTLLTSYREYHAVSFRSLTAVLTNNREHHYCSKRLTTYYQNKALESSTIQSVKSNQIREPFPLPLGHSSQPAQCRREFPKFSQITNIHLFLLQHKIRIIIRATTYSCIYVWMVFTVYSHLATTHLTVHPLISDQKKNLHEKTKPLPKWPIFSPELRWLLHVPKFRMNLFISILPGMPSWGRWVDLASSPIACIRARFFHIVNYYEIPSLSLSLPFSRFPVSRDQIPRCKQVGLLAIQCVVERSC